MTWKQNNDLRIALVIPWFGEELKGGAESQAWQLSTRLAAAGVAVEVLTTCSKTFTDNWCLNHYPPGETQEQGVTVRRFKVNTKPPKRFGKLVRTLLSIPHEKLIPGVSPLKAKSEATFARESINSDELMDFLRENAPQYDAVLFIPYLYGPILNGLSLAGDRAILQPCLHDEAYAYMDCVTHVFKDANKLFFNSQGELELAQQLYGPSVLTKAEVMYEGVEVDSQTLNALSQEPLVEGRYLLYMGRRDKTKNTDTLIRAFDTYASKNPNSLTLVLTGTQELPLTPKSSQCLDLGLVSEEEKLNLLKNCTAVVNPSLNESFSRLIFEGWLAGKPVVVNRNCLSTYRTLQESGRAGWAAGAEQDFVTVFEKISACDDQELVTIGEKGRAYAAAVANWDAVIERYIHSFKKQKLQRAKIVSKKRPRKVLQLSAGYTSGDAISEQMHYIRKIVQNAGHECDIYAEHVLRGATRVHNIKMLHEFDSEQGDLLIYHHSIGSHSTQAAIHFAGNKALIYHNITPAEFYRESDPGTARLLQEGREKMSDLAQEFPLSFGVSDFNRQELVEFGFNAPGVLPLLIDPGKWAQLPDKDVLETLQDGRKNILFVGRISPHKRQNEIISFYNEYRKYYDDARLILAGSAHLESPYYKDFLSSLKNSPWRKDIVYAGHINDAQLQACFRAADVYLSFSEHEGFGVPLIEAMWFDVPVLAYASSAIPETLSSAGFMVTDKSDLQSLAALLHMVLNDDELRDEIILAQRAVCSKYSVSALRQEYNDKLLSLLD